MARFDLRRRRSRVPRPRRSAPSGGRYGTAGGRDSALTRDELLLQHLELHLSHQDGGPGRHGDGPDHGLTIESATRSPNHPVVWVPSDEQNLTAAATTFSTTCGPRSPSQRPEPPPAGMSAEQDGNRSMQTNSRSWSCRPAGRGRGAVTALGPARSTSTTRTANTLPTHAAWQHKLVSTKDGDQDLIVLTGTATFTDDEQQTRGRHPQGVAGGGGRRGRGVPAAGADFPPAQPH